ncbi:MAG: methyltransferase RsmF C-terminal domain-like protein [Candidatus Pacearchaeota archaeon]
MKAEFYNSKQRKELLEKLNGMFGIKDIPKTLFETGREKVRGFSGDLTIDELYALDRLTNIEFMGLYLFKEEMGHLRFGFDGTILFKDQIVKNVVEITKEQLEKWMTGNNLDIALERGMWIVKHEGDVFGCGLSDTKHLINFVPKERRIRRS